ncbi:(d)CMP kinase [Pseudenhygromyxa sp. WMMC2535]|uniref:(d)CMP kinase n=1 Tax=Pseudenhygromyxa sp. WMMC2535 TaxID=2712867 RepID=UPI001554F4EE|nr:(d)CMP kinase [Pseudenhygromyxa sp. WMMC2535]NVB42187.1 (d)CMP kinase [Pseudenhygromyxa sp. WMMC2535]
MSGPLIVIDGPAGAGKSTVATAVAQRIGAALLDTGAIYRALAWLARERGVSWDEEVSLAGLASEIAIEFRPVSEVGARQQVLLVAPVAAELTDVIRTPAISEGASRVSRHPAVRGALLGIQRAIAARAIAASGCVAEGRDMGTVVFPDAAHKFFLTASRATRADRRFRELAAKGLQGSVAEVEADIARRDERDSSRDVAPLARAEDAVLIDSSGLDIEQVVARILDGVNPPA